MTHETELLTKADIAESLYAWPGYAQTPVSCDYLGDSWLGYTRDTEEGWQERYLDSVHNRDYLVIRLIEAGYEVEEWD